MSKTYDYVYASGKLMRQVLTVTIGDSTTTYAMDFFYDASGYPFAVKYNGDLCYYVTNLQGDVMSIVDPQGEVVAEYEYDPYGNILAATGPLADVNPLRYRGYVFDSETNFYYLQSRYYDSEICRFINTDTLFDTDAGLQGFDLFIYCGNNPVNYWDPTGLFLLELWDSFKENFNSITKELSSVYALLVTGTQLDSPAPGPADAVFGIAIGGVLLFTTVFSIGKVVEEQIEKSETRRKKEYQYWEAYRYKNTVLIGRGLTFVEASLRVACGLDIMCANPGAAKTLLIINGYWNAVGPEIHGEEGYYLHYHPNRNSHVHIWFY